MPLRAYLVALTLATLLPVAVFGAIVGYFLVEEQRQTFRRGAEERTLALLTAVDAELRGSLDAITLLSQAASLDDDLAYFRITAKRVLASQPHWVNINVARPDRSRVLDLLAADGAALPPITDDGEIEGLLRERKPVIANLAAGPVSRQWNFGVRAPVVRGGEVKYVLSAVVRPDAIARIVTAQNLPDGWVGVVLDRNNRIVARTFEPEKSQGELASQSLREALARSPSGWFRGSTIEGTPVYTPYRRSEISGWAFAMGIPAAALDAAAWRGVGLLVVGLLGALGLAVWLARGVGRRLATPIAELAQASEALGRDEAARVPDTARVHEVRLLARSFQKSVDTLRASEERMRSVVDHVVDGIISIDEAGVIQTFNPAAERIFGYAAPEVVGRNVRMLMPEAYSREHDGYIANYVRTGQAKIIGIGREVEGLRRDGSTFPLDLAVSVFHIGARRYFTGVVRDITERKKAEEVLRQADRHKDEFLAMLSHELRNPLAALTAAAHVLKVSDPAGDASAKARGVIQRQTKHMARLIADLLDVGRVSAGKVGLARERMDLADAVSAVASEWRGSGRFDRHHLSLELASVWVDADRARMEQIAANLFDNAVKFTPAGKGIRVSVRADGDSAVLRVHDEGIGLQAEEGERIFDLFMQGRHAEGGMGVGLALVKRLVELHGGTVAADSEGVGRGAAFTVRLPAAAAPGVDAEPEKSLPGAARSVLLIEDNDDTRHMLEAALAAGGHSVRSARDGAGGLALAAQSPPEVALIDIGLPDMDGYELARRLRAARGCERLSMVAITGYGRPEDRQRAVEAGFAAHLTKPVTPERLRRALAGLP